MFESDRWELRFRAIIAASAVIDILATIFFLSQGTTIVFQNIYYLTIVLASYRYRWKGAYFSTALSAVYLVLCAYFDPQFDPLLQAGIRTVIFVLIAFVVAFLSNSLQNEKKRYQAIFSTSGSGMIVVLGKDRIIKETNARFLDLSKEGSVIGNPIGTYFQPGDIETLISSMSGNEHPKGIELEMMLRTGERRVVIATANHLDSDEIVLSIVDITERKQAEEALLEREAFLNEVGGIASVGGWQLDIGSRKVHWTKETYRIHGIPEGQDYDLSGAIQFYDMPGRSILEEALGRCMNSGDSFDLELPFTSMGGSHLWVRAVGHATMVDGRAAQIKGTFQDITDRKLAQISLNASEEKFREIFNNVKDGILINLMLPSGAPGRCTECNDFACQMLGYSRDEMLAMAPAEYDTGFHNPPLEKVLDDLRLRSHAKFETEHRRKDGSVVPVEISAHRTELNGTEVILAVIRDVTERKKAEEALLQTNRNLNLLSSITRHDTLNQITVIQGYANLLEHSGLTSKQMDYIGRIDRSADMIQGQVEFTKQYQDIGAKEPAWQSLHSSIVKAKTSLNLGQLTLQENGPDYFVRADPMFEKVVYNLVENCLRHSGGARRMEISASESEGSLRIVFEDDGQGIAQEDRIHLFERGFGKNTGYGLFLSREILSITHITMTENSEPGKGARFEIVVPKGAWQSA